MMWGGRGSECCMVGLLGKGGVLSRDCRPGRVRFSQATAA